MVGAEALLRWNHPTRGPVSPAEFIPIAEETGLIIPLGEWVLREACREAAQWPDHMTIAVNVSAVQIKSPRLTAAIVSALEESRLQPRQLEIEITESVLADEVTADRMITAMHALGVRLALDDFGTGYSSLAYLSRFTFDKIKIDQSFVRQAIESPVCAAIVDAVSGLARNLAMSTVAEGIETEAELDVVRAAGCTQGQGYHFGRPMSPVALRAMIDDQAATAKPVTGKAVPRAA
jgi:EAL domain-containing protein (putative c-di-GMP-specific phosphodiesterase class I)